MEPDRQDLLLLVLRQGGKRDAIKLYQEETGADLPAARLAVAELANRGHAGGRRYAGTTAVVLTLLAGVLIAVLFSQMLGP